MEFEPSSPRRANAGGIFLIALFITVTTSLPLCAQPVTPANSDPLHAWAAGIDPATFGIWVNQHLAAAQVDVDKLTAGRGQLRTRCVHTTMPSMSLPSRAMSPT